MKHAVVSDEHPETLLRPGTTYAELAERIAQDAARMLPVAQRRETTCPACASAASASVFEKLGFAFRECGCCHSFFVSPRPDGAALARYHTDSGAARLWRERFFLAESADRTERIFTPRAAWVADSVLEHELKGPVVDLRSRYAGFLSELSRSKVFPQSYSAEPIEELRPRLPELGWSLLPSPDSPDAAAVCLMDILVESGDPATELARAQKMLQPGGLIFAIIRSASGFEFQMLRERSESFLPPHHLNLFSVAGISGLVERCGFELSELSTPGQLDVHQVRRAALTDASLKLPPFLDDIVRDPGTEVLRSFQEFLQRASRSSHLRLAARRRAS